MRVRRVHGFEGVEGQGEDVGAFVDQHDFFGT